MIPTKNKLAFPESCTNEGHRANVDDGMDLRDYFANGVLHSLIMKSGDDFDYHWGNGKADKKPDLAKKAYGMADAMMKQREL